LSGNGRQRTGVFVVGCLDEDALVEAEDLAFEMALDVGVCTVLCVKWMS
jgi:hypothetical protein